MSGYMTLVIEMMQCTLSQYTVYQYEASRVRYL